MLLFLLALVFGKGMDFSTQEIMGYTTMVVSLLFVYFGIRHFRDKHNGGSVTFGKAMLIGLLISAFAGLGIGIIDYIYTTVINPDFAQEYLSQTLASMEANLSAEEYEKQKVELTQQMEAYGGSGFMAALMFATVVMIGLVISLISALILQRK